MATCSEAPVLILFRRGFVADAAVVRRLLDLEQRGCTFRLENGGRFRVIPGDRLTADDVSFLRARRDEARRVLEYQADDGPCSRRDVN
jgi:hypothetical protein